MNKSRVPLRYKRKGEDARTKTWNVPVSKKVGKRKKEKKKEGKLTKQEK